MLTVQDTYSDKSTVSVCEIPYLQICASSADGSQCDVLINRIIRFSMQLGVLWDCLHVACLVHNDDCGWKLHRRSHVDTAIGSSGIPSARWSEIIGLDLRDLLSRSVGFR
jgi:hypothetical protein